MTKKQFDEMVKKAVIKTKSPNKFEDSDEVDMLNIDGMCPTSFLAHDYESHCLLKKMTEIIKNHKQVYRHIILN